MPTPLLPTKAARAPGANAELGVTQGLRPLIERERHATQRHRGPGGAPRGEVSAVLTLQREVGEVADLVDGGDEVVEALELLAELRDARDDGGHHDSAAASWPMVSPRWMTSQPPRPSSAALTTALKAREPTCWRSTAHGNARRAPGCRTA